MTISSSIFIIVYVQKLVIHVLTSFFSSILFLTFIESILENVNDLVCLSFLSNEGNTYIFNDNGNDTIESFSYFSVMEDKTIMDQNILIISNIKLKMIFPKNFVAVSHEYKSCYCYCTYNQHNSFFNENIFSRHGKIFSKWWYQDSFDKITVKSDT